jgi:hypothetical protein
MRRPELRLLEIATDECVAGKLMTGPLPTRSQYLEVARQCERRAKSAGNREERAEYLQRAMTFRRLAESRLPGGDGKANFQNTAARQARRPGDG